MINKKDLIQLMKDATMKLAGLYQAETFSKVWTEDEIKISQKEVGGKVEVIGQGGTLTPAEDGDYEMEDGFKFTVKDGQIASIEGEEPVQEEQPAEEAPVEQAEAPVAEEPAQEEAPVEEQPNEVEELKAKVADLEATVAALQQAMEELKGLTEVAATKEDVEAFSKQVQELNDNIQKLAKVPVEFSKTTSNNMVKDNKDEKLFELAKMIGGAVKK